MGKIIFDGRGVTLDKLMVVGDIYRITEADGSVSLVKYDGLRKKDHCKTCECTTDELAFTIISPTYKAGLASLRLIEEA